MPAAIDDRQSADTLMMVRPARFGSNPDTAASNAFQNNKLGLTSRELADRACAEFDAMVAELEAAQIRVLVFDDTVEPEKPDAIFPNNWVSFHCDGTVVLYPMEAENRRLERRLDIVESMSADHGFFVRDILDLSGHESSGQFLEGTGSMVLDRKNLRAYAALSSRAHMDMLAEFSQLTDYALTVFDASGPGGLPIYHTNVMMGIGEKFAAICADAIADPKQRGDVIEQLSASGRSVLELSVEQMCRFAGNLLEVNACGEPVIVMSAAARASFSESQLSLLESNARIVTVDVATIEAAGGGSVRCMMAEVFLPAGEVGRTQTA